MKTNTLILLLLFCFAASGQNVINNECKWYQKYHSVYWGHGGVMTEITQNTDYYTQGDTVINNITHFKMYENQVFRGLSHQDGFKTYYHPFNDSTFILFDFGISVGDTFIFHAPNYPGTLKNVVTTVDTVQIKGKDRKRIQFEKFPNYAKGPQWIEGIGDVNFGGIELDYSYVVYENNTKQLLCFIQDNQKIYGECTLGMDEKTNKSHFFPNPTPAYVRIDLSDFEKPTKIMLYSIKGKKLREFFSLENEISLDMRSYKSGVYIIQLWDSKKLLSQKILKE